MDIMMPEMDGLDTMREIRKIPQCKDLPIIAVTAKAMKGDREKCIEAGAWDYLSKPVDPEQLLGVLRGLAATLERKRDMNSVHDPGRRPASPAGRSTTPPNASNILIVDDRARQALVFRTILEELGQNIVTAASGEEALRWLLDNEFAVILLDVNMPGMDGLETAALIRARRKSAHTPIIFITAYADEMHTARGYSLGAVDYILSPVVPDILRTKVKVLRAAAPAERRARSAAPTSAWRWRRSRRRAPRRRSRSAAPSSSPRRPRSWRARSTWTRSSTGAARLVVPFLADYCAHRARRTRTAPCARATSVLRSDLGAASRRATRRPSRRMLAEAPGAGHRERTAH